jgi:hypothetical protein
MIATYAVRASDSGTILGSTHRQGEGTGPRPAALTGSLVS